MIKKKSMKKTNELKRRNNDEEKQKRRNKRRRGEIRLKGGRRSLVGGAGSTSATLKRLHVLKRREITFGSTLANGV
ncbi:hypothetical protein MTR67_022781 [Solanum verrucosum]|uniref:Uncharacterized protein n=1 Tax=Solanum verrucosum TaxID=315347 RepID=A0AAF0QZL1_SOLVR|nr:hypothetical protein MTR67_022781 [Solanum verrucosum]